MSQCNDILKLLKRNGKRGVTALDIWYQTGSLRASARIDDLRNQGHRIECERRKMGKKTVHVYCLEAAL